MKIMNCKQLGGACDLEFRAETFEEMVDLSKKHGMKMFQKNDAAHLEAMEKIRDRMQTPEDMIEWQESRRNTFDALPDA